MSEEQQDKMQSLNYSNDAPRRAFSRQFWNNLLWAFLGLSVGGIIFGWAHLRLKW